MKYRFAKESDLKEIVDLHYSVREFYPTGFFSKTRKSFLRTYYKILIHDPNEIVFCAESNGEIRGFCTGSLDVEKQQRLFAKKKIKLGLSLISTILFNPKFLLEILNRYSSIQNKSKENKYIIDKGARSEYWTWSKDGDDSEYSVKFYS